MARTSAGTANSTSQDIASTLPGCARDVDTWVGRSSVVQYGMIARVIVTSSGPIGRVTAISTPQKVLGSRTGRTPRAAAPGAGMVLAGVLSRSGKTAVHG